MGLLSELRSRAGETARRGVKKVIQRVAAQANIPMNESREEKDRAEIEAAKAQGAPTFAEQGGEGWALGRAELARLGTEGLGMIQARWTESELSARERVEAFTTKMDGACGLDKLRWGKAGDLLLTGWQARGVEVAEAWTKTFDDLGAAWEKAARDHGAKVHTEGWRQAAADFDRAWQTRWEYLQGQLQQAGARMKATVADARGALGDGLPQPTTDAFVKAGVYLENTILRAEAELWGVWGTNGARIRGVSRVVTEGRGTAEDSYPGVFAACRGDFDVGFHHTLSDFESSWKNALSLIEESA